MNRTNVSIALMSAILATAALPGCSMVGKLTGKAKTPSAPADLATGGIDAPKVAASDDDPIEVRSVIQTLDEMEGFAKSGGNPRFAAVSAQLGKRLFLAREDVIWKHAKYAQMKQRYLAIKLAFAKQAGPRAVEIMSDAIPVEATNADAQDAVESSLEACRTLARVASAKDELATYEEKLARARKLDAKTVRAKGQDVAFASCELVLSASKLDFEDEYAPEENHGEVEKGCGKQAFSLRAVRVGPDQWGEFQRVAGSVAVAERVACNKLPRKDRYDKKHAAGVADLEQYLGASGVAVWNGKYETMTDEEDLHVYKYADLELFSKDLTFAKNPCGGGTDAKLVCEASGSRAAASHNRVVHYLARADVHRKVGRADRCKSFLQAAVKESVAFAEMVNDAKKTKEWTAGLTYKTRTGETLAEAELIARVKEQGKKADEQALAGWCQKK